MGDQQRVSQKVLILGAGPSGLVALKEMREKGHDAHILEKSQLIGGVFSRDKYSAYNLTISNHLMSFSDFPPQEGLRISSKDEYCDYLEK
mmetsp:Transcript_21590/g.50080  ORF Transcript_21590/g.50080 Transcript_21590/m.50080 type:complete len:90 (+) Transcript_21590:167-436(+)